MNEELMKLKLLTMKQTHGVKFCSINSTCLMISFLLPPNLPTKGKCKASHSPGRGEKQTNLFLIDWLGGEAFSINWQSYNYYINSLGA